MVMKGLEDSLDSDAMHACMHLCMFEGMQYCCHMHAHACIHVQILGVPLEHPADMEAVDKALYHCISQSLDRIGEIEGFIAATSFFIHSTHLLALHPHCRIGPHFHSHTAMSLDQEDRRPSPL